MWYHYLSQSQARARAREPRAVPSVHYIMRLPCTRARRDAKEKEKERGSEKERVAGSGVYILRDVPRIYPYYTRRLGGELRCFPERARDIATETETASAISTHVLLRRTVPEDEERERERYAKERLYREIHQFARNLAGLLAGVPRE